MNISWLWDKIYNFNWYDIGSSLLSSLLYLVVMLIIARLVYSLIVYFLRRVLVERKGNKILDERKAHTMFSLLKSVAFYLIAFSVIVHGLNHLFNFNTGALLASASILGVALGFGSQSLVKDMIAGFFILFEDQFSVSEYVEAGDFSGIVEETGIRATRLRDWGGELHIIPNGSITTVTNFSRGKMRALVDVPVPYGENIDHIIEVMESVCQSVCAEFGEKIVEAPNVQGIVKFGEFNVVIRIVAFTRADEQWGLERELRRRIHSAFLQEGIRTPQYPTSSRRD